MRSRYAKLVAVAVVMVLGVTVAAGCGKKAETEPVKVGVVLTLTTDLALYGNQQVSAIKMAAERFNNAGGINGRKIELIIEDSANSNTTAINAVNKVLSAKPAVVLGPIMGTQILAMLPVVQKDGVPLITIAGTRKITQQGYDGIFRFLAHDGISKVAWTKFAVEELKAKKIGLLVVANEWGYSARDITSKVLKEKYGLEPVSVETYQATDKDMSAQLLNLQRKGVDLIMQQGHPADTALILKQRRQLGIDVPIMCSNTVQTAANLPITEGSDVDGVYAEGYPVPWQDPDPKLQEWATQFEKAFGMKPDQYAVLEYDAACMVFEVMKKYGTDRESIKRGLREMTYQGLINELKADKEGNMIDNVTIMRYQADKRYTVLGRVRVPENERY